MSHPLLHNLGRKGKASVFNAVDTPACVEVPEGMEAGVLCGDDRVAFFILLAAVGRHACRNLRRDKAALDDVGVILNVALAVREDETEVALRALQLLLAERVHDNRRQRDRSLPGIRFRHPHFLIAVGPLAHMQKAPLQVNVIPPQAAQFG